MSNKKTPERKLAEAIAEMGIDKVESAIKMHRETIKTHQESVKSANMK